MMICVACYTCGRKFDLEIVEHGNLPNHHKPVIKGFGVRISAETQYVMIDIYEPCPASGARIEMVDRRYAKTP
jgi:hypothetical protein